ncbi:hypothetical protein PCURB6_37540 [Paenibacillus curdlanolyticus]|nr:hypothetical protein PCURB6_37540 [Paenibacillus curdlanolyticus]
MPRTAAELLIVYHRFRLFNVKAAANKKRQTEALTIRTDEIASVCTVDCIFNSFVFLLNNCVIKQ